jgi:hypothetical protein
LGLNLRVPRVRRGGEVSPIVAGRLFFQPGTPRRGGGNGTPEADRPWGSRDHFDGAADCQQSEDACRGSYTDRCLRPNLSIHDTSVPRFRLNRR